MARKSTPPLPEPTAEDAAKVVAMGEGIIVEEGDPTGDDRDIGRPMEAPSELVAFEEAQKGLPDQQTDMLSRLTEAMESLSKREVSTASPDAGLAAMMATAMTSLATAIERMTEGQMKSAQLVANATMKAQRPSNEFAPKISVFNLRGDKDFPKPQLKCEMLIPWPAEYDSSTREECELLNLLQPGEYRVKRNDDTFVKMTVRVVTKLDSDEPSRLWIHHDTAFNNDNHRLLPPTNNWLRQMLKQNPKTRDAERLILTMEEEAALILAGQLNDRTKPTDGKVVSVGE